MAGLRVLCSSVRTVHPHCWQPCPVAQALFPYLQQFTWIYLVSGTTPTSIPWGPLPPKKKTHFPEFKRSLVRNLGASYTLRTAQLPTQLCILHSLLRYIVCAKPLLPELCLGDLNQWPQLHIQQRRRQPPTPGLIVLSHFQPPVLTRDVRAIPRNSWNMLRESTN